MNAIRHANHRILLDYVWLIGEEFSDIRMKFSVPVEFWIYMRTISRGIDPTNI